MTIKFVHKQRGLSLIELMVAMGLGALLLLGLATVFTTANQSSKRRSTAENLHEVARQVMSRLEYDLHNAGYLDPFSSAKAAQASFDVEDPQVLAIYARQAANLTGNLKEATPLGKFTEGKMVPLLGCNGDFSDIKPNLEALSSCSSGGLRLQQSLQVGYQSFAPDSIGDKEKSDISKASPRSLALRAQEQDQSLSGAGRDCIGRKVTNKDGLVVNRYSVRATTDGTAKSFGCSSSAGNDWQGIIEGVEEMTFRYLVTPINKTQAGEKVDLKEATSGLETLTYLPASKVEQEPLKWASVVGVEVCVIVAVDPLNETREAAFSGVQKKVPTCERKAGLDAITANAEFKDEYDRRAGDSRYYKRYVQVITMPNSLYIPVVSNQNTNP